MSIVFDSGGNPVYVKDGVWTSDFNFTAKGGFDDDPVAVLVDDGKIGWYWSGWGTPFYCPDISVLDSLGSMHFYQTSYDSNEGFCIGSSNDIKNATGQTIANNFVQWVNDGAKGNTPLTDSKYTTAWLQRGQYLFVDNVDGLAPVSKAKLKGVTVSLNNKSATVGTAYTGKLTITPTPADDGTYSYSYTSSDSALKIDSNGNITGTPTKTGSITITGKCTDSFNTSYSGTASISVSAASFNLSLSPTSLAAYTVGVTSTDTCTATTDAVSPVYKWEALVDGVVNSGVTAAISGATTNKASLTYSFTSVHSNCSLRCTVTDKYGDVKTASANFTINAAPVQKAHLSTIDTITPSSSANWKTGQSVNITIQVDCTEDDDGSYIYTPSSTGQSHADMTVTDNGKGKFTITGTPSTAGTWNFQVSAVDSYTASASSPMLHITIDESASGILDMNNRYTFPTNWTLAKGSKATYPIEIDVPNDDGTFKFSWWLNGGANGLGYGWYQSDNASCQGNNTSTDPVARTSANGGNKIFVTNTSNPTSPGTANTTGKDDIELYLSDTHGNGYKVSPGGYITVS